jgi:DNA invertase Pin-like site-specific DNA recombinase
VHGRLILTVLGGLAEFERELIRARAVANGVRLGRKPTLTHHQQLVAI